MDVTVFNPAFEVTGIIDSYDSLLWNIKYNEYGDFEMVVPYASGMISLLSMDSYLMIPFSDRTMIIEKIVPTFDGEKGYLSKVTGRSLESILSRRIIWKQTTISGNLQNGIKKLITDAIINPTDQSRKIPNFIFKDSTDSTITSITINECQFTGDNLYDVIQSLCSLFSIGFKITLNDNFQFVFELYNGSDRSSNQLLNPIIEFSNNNDNLISSEYSIDQQNYCNVTLIAGEDEGTSRKTATYGSASGLSRRELFTDARDIQSTDGETTMTPTEYTNALINRGKEKLLEHDVTTEFDSSVDNGSDGMFEFNVDYFLGDIVDIVDVIEETFKVRVSEMTISISESEYSIHPIFSLIE